MCLQGCGDSALRSTRHQIGVALVGCKVVRLQGSGMVLYDLPAIRSVALVWLQGCGDSALWATRHQIGGPGVAARLWG